MLRAIVLVLLLANGGYFAWSHHWLEGMGLAPEQQGEPERLRQQVRAELLQVVPAQVQRAKAGKANAPVSAPPPAEANVVPPPLTPAAAIPSNAASPVGSAEVASTTASAPEGAAANRQNATECLQAGIFDNGQAEALRRAAAVLPRGSWQLETATLPGRWMVYMGRLADAETVSKKRTELREIGVDYDRPGASLEPGLSLGRFSTEEAAQRGLVTLTKKGVRSARVVQERLDLPGFMLRLPAADAQLKAQAQALGGALAGKTLRACS